MKLPPHVLTTLCLTGAAGALVVAIGCEKIDRAPQHEQVIDEIAEPVIVEPPLVDVMREPQFAQPPPGAAPQPLPPPPPVTVRKPKPVSKPIVKSHDCGPCGRG